jgi:hypothetical protein
MLHVEYAENPLYEYLTQERLMPGEFAILAGVGQSTVYEILRCAVRVLPQFFVHAVTERSGPGAGAKMRESYGFFREDLRSRLQKGS